MRCGRLCLLVCCLLLPAASLRAAPSVGPRHAPRAPIEHVFLIGFDNTHLEDIQQLPALWGFLQRGAFTTNSHTILPSHTAAGFLAIGGGVYPDQTGIPNNSFYAGPGTKRTVWSYWESLALNGKPYNYAPPPWQLYNRAGLDFGSVAFGPTTLEQPDEVAAHTALSPVSNKPDDYLGLAIYRASGERLFGTPNVPWLWETVGAFPGFGVQAPWSLAATYQMHTHGIPVTYTYIDNPHSGPRGPKKLGEYGDTLAEWDSAFADFFTRLGQAGIDERNSLFIFTIDEGDYYVEPGVRNTSLRAWLTGPPADVPDDALRIIPDSGPLVYLSDPALVPPALESLAEVPGWEAIAGPAQLRMQHTSSRDDPERAPSFVLFGQGDVYYSDLMDPSRPGGSRALERNPRILWNHGTLHPAITSTWLGLVGPGIGTVPADLWVDHTDIVPTILYLLGIEAPAYLPGRPMWELLDPALRPAGYQADPATWGALAGALKQIDAPMGRLSQTSLRLSTRGALIATTPEGQAIEAFIAAKTAERDALAAEIGRLLRDLGADRPADPSAATALTARASALVQELELAVERARPPNK